MSTPPDKLTIEEVEAYLKYCDVPSVTPYEFLPIRIAKQLADTMRENERLRCLIKIGLKCIDDHDAIYKEGRWEMLARKELYPNKDSDNG